MPLENVRRKILDEAEETASRIKEDGSSEAQRILSEAEARANEIEHKAQEDANAETKRILKEHEIAMEIEVGSMLAEAKGLALERVTADVTSRMKSMLEEKYMAKMLESGISKFEEVYSGEIVVLASKNNKKLVESLKKKVVVKDHGGDGIILKSKDGSISLRISPDALIEENMDIVRSMVSARLFGGKKTGSDERTEEEMI